MTLVELVIGLGLLSVLSLGVVQFLSMTEKGVDLLKIDSEVRLVHNQLRRLLEQQEICSASLTGIDPMSTAALTSLKDDSGNSLITVGSDLGLKIGAKGMVQLQSIVFGGSFTSIGANPEIGLVPIEVVYEKKAGDVTATRLKRKEVIKVKLAGIPPANVESCSLFSSLEGESVTEEKGFWKVTANGQGIFYDQGPVLINLDEKITGFESSSAQRLLETGGENQDVNLTSYSNNPLDSSDYKYFRSFGTSATKSEVLGSNTTIGGMVGSVSDGTSLKEIIKLETITDAGFDVSSGKFNSKIVASARKDGVNWKPFMALSSSTTGGHIRLGSNIDVGACTGAAICFEGEAAIGIQFTDETPSDLRLKKNIWPYLRGVEFLKNALPYWAHYKSNPSPSNLVEQSNEDSLMLMAQDVGMWLPETVGESGGVLTLNYQGLLYPLINGLKFLANKLDSKKTEVKLMQQSVSQMRRENQILKEEFSKRENGLP